EERRLQVWANADYPRDAERARAFGAQGIGLDRTEHMFMEMDRLPIVHEMILAAPDYRKVSAEVRAIRAEIDTAKEDRRSTLEKRLATLEPVLEDLSRRYLGSLEKLARLEAVAATREANPMLGLRGCRLGITFPEITEMQVRAIFEASCALTKEGVVVKPEIMIPLAGHVNELKVEREALEREAKKV